MAQSQNLILQSNIQFNSVFLVSNTKKKKKKLTNSTWVYQKERIVLKNNSENTSAGTEMVRNMFKTKTKKKSQ